MKSYLRITLWYLLFGGSWIFITDRFVGPFARNVEALTELQTVKGWVYVLLSGALIYFLTKRAAAQEELAEKRRMEDFKRTVKGSHHILLNYFNQMQLVILEAERSPDFDQKLVKLAKEMTEEAADEVLKMEKEGLADIQSPRDPSGGSNAG